MFKTMGKLRGMHAVLLIIGLLVPGKVVAQKLSQAKVDGTITNVANGMYQVKPRHGEQVWVVRPQGMSHYLGTASRQWLRPGMVVMVTAPFDQKGNATVPVSSVVAFTPRPGRVMGVVADPGDTADPKDKTVPHLYMVSGPIKSIKDNQLVISIGRKQYTMEMSDELVVSVDLLNDLSWVQAKDDIVAKVKYAQKGQGLGIEVEVTGKELLQPRPEPLTRRELRARALREKRAAAAGRKDGDHAEPDAAESKDGQSPEDEDVDLKTTDAD